jgi:hypothetical protein
MATLADCTVHYFREMFVRMLFFNEVPPWELTTGGTPYQWTPTIIRAVLHKTADPGEDGDSTTNKADYTGYANVAIARDSTAWQIAGTGTANPIISNKNPITWPVNTGVSQDIYAVSLALLDSSTEHAIARDALAAAVTINTTTTKTPNIGGGQFTFRIR